MNDAERLAQIRADFDRIMAEFVALPPSRHKGSFTVHFSGREIRAVDWNVKDDAAHWRGERREAS